MATHDPTLECLTTVRIGKNGRLTIPKQFCEDIELKKGSPVAIFRLGNGLLLLPEHGHYDHLRPKMLSNLIDTGLTSTELLATLPEARARVYTRHYGKTATGRFFRCRREE